MKVIGWRCLKDEPDYPAFLVKNAFRWGWVRQWDTLLFPVGKTSHGEAGEGEALRISFLFANLTVSLPSF